MEASAAAGPGPGQGDGGQQGEGEGAAGQGPDVSALAATLGEMRQGQEQIHEFLRSAPWQQQGEEPAAEPQLPELDLSALNLDDPGFDPAQMAQHLTGYIEQQAQQRTDALLKEHIEPLKQQQDMLRRSAEARDLVGEFPEMAEEETARNVLGIAQQLAETWNMPALANNVGMWRMIYLAGRATDAANAEGDEASPPAHLEGGGGAGPGGGQQAGMTAADIVGARKGSTSLPFP